MKRQSEIQKRLGTLDASGELANMVVVLGTGSRWTEVRRLTKSGQTYVGRRDGVSIPMKFHSNNAVAIEDHGGAL